MGAVLSLYHPGRSVPGTWFFKGTPTLVPVPYKDDHASSDHVLDLLKEPGKK